MRDGLDRQNIQTSTKIIGKEPAMKELGKTLGILVIAPEGVAQKKIRMRAKSPSKQPEGRPLALNLG